MNNIEPGADMRQFALANYEVYVAFLQAGFESDQAFALTRDFMMTSMKGGKS